jgi:DNA topoisomerase-1
MVKKGRFGPYIQAGQIVANVPRGMTMEEVTLDEAVALLTEKGKALKPKPGAAKRKAPAKGTLKAAAAKMTMPKKEAAPKKAAAKKPAAKRVAAKKPAAKKPAVKKATIAKAG